MSFRWTKRHTAIVALPLWAAVAGGCGESASPVSHAGAAGGTNIATNAGNRSPSGGAGAPAAVVGAVGVRSVTIRFRPELLGQTFACGQQYPGVGATHITVEPADFRFFVQGLRLIDRSGNEVPVTLDERAPWQISTVALLDFENQTGACGQGNPETNDQITGTVPQGDYTGVAFSNGVPEAFNHEDPLKHPAPLQFTDMTWGWLGGFKFFVSELHAVGAYEADGGSDVGTGLLHVGSRNCSGDRNVSITCLQLDRNEVRLQGFDPDSNVIAADIGQVFSQTDLRVDAQCHSAGDFCAPMFQEVGVDWTSGMSMPTQQVYSVK